MNTSLRDGGEGEADTADDEIGGHLVGAEREQLHGIVELDRPEDEAIVFKLDDPELQRVADAHREDGWLRRLIGDGRVVVAIDDRDGVGRQYGLHARSLLPCKTHGDEARPSAARSGATRAYVFEDAERKLHKIECCRAGRHGVMNGSA